MSSSRQQGQWVKRHPGGCDLFIRLTPKSSKDELGGIAAASDGSRHLAARVRAVPDKGQANRALERLLADRLGLPASAVSIVAGSTSRLKTVRLRGDPDAIARLLEAAIGSAEKTG